MDLLDRLLQHDAWTTGQLLLRSQELTDADLDREFDIGHRSVRATFEHVIANMEIWGDLMGDVKVDPATDPRRKGKSLDEMLVRLNDAAANLARIARDVADRDAWDKMWTDSLDGRQKSYGGSIAHVITHSMHHRAQLLYLLRQLGLADLPEGDVLSWEGAMRSGQIGSK